MASSVGVDAATTSLAGLITISQLSLIHILIFLRSSFFKKKQVKLSLTMTSRAGLLIAEIP